MAKKAPRTQPSALSLWSHPGELAAAMRAAKVKMTPAAYAAASMDTTLQVLGDVRVRLEGDTRVYSQGDADIATLRLEGDALVLQFAAPDPMEPFADVAHHYTALERPGWLELRRPATRDPRPGLEAKVGAVLGRASLERRERARG